MSTAIEQNVEARKAANAVVELGITLAKDEGLEAEQVRRMWQCVREIAGTLIGEEDEPAPQPLSVHEQWSTTSVQDDEDSLDADPFPFGKYGPEGEGLCYGDVPDSYYRWLSQQDWIERWPEVAQYIEENGLG